jgi:hypothetical protein
MYKLLKAMPLIKKLLVVQPERASPYFQIRPLNFTLPSNPVQFISLQPSSLDIHFTIRLPSLPLFTAGITVNPCLTQGIRSSKAVLSVNPRWTNLILYGNNGDTGMRPWKVKVKKHKNHKFHLTIYL